MQVNNSIKSRSIFNIIVVFASVFFCIQILFTTISFAQSQQKVTKASTSSKQSPSLSTPTVSIAAKSKKDAVEDEGERQAKMLEDAIEFTRKNFALMVIIGSSIVIFGYVVVPRLIPKKVQTSHGSAHFATRSELKHLLRPMGDKIASGELRIGKYNETWRPTHKYIHLSDKLTLRHNIVLAPTGVGKSYSIFLPNCYFNQDSFICTDPKSELWQKTSGVQPNPIRFAPTDPDNSMAFNFIPICKSIKVAKRLTSAIVYAEGVDNGDKFWTNGERQLLTALLHYTAFTEVPTPTHAYELLCTGAENLIPQLAQSNINSVRRLSTSFVKLTEKALTGIVQGLTGKLNWLEEPAVRRFTSSTKESFDFSQLKQKPTQVYFCLNEDDVSELPQLIAVFFNMAMVTLKTCEGNTPVKFLLDEFGNIGRLLNFEKDITLIRSKNISVTAGLQAIAQIEKLYGKSEAEIILGNFTNKIILNSLEPKTADFVSRMVGDLTHTERKITKVNNGGMLGGGTTTESEISHARPLLTSDEITRLKDNELLLVSGNLAPLMLETIQYREPSKVAPCQTCPEEIPIGK